MSNNYSVNRSVINIIQARDFFPDDYAERYKNLLSLHKFVPMKYGKEIPHFNMIYPELEIILGKMVGEFIEIVKEESGTFRITLDHVQFEEYRSLNEWRFAVALEDTKFRTYEHISGAKSAMDGFEDFDYIDMDQWVLDSEINLKQNQAIFYRPWLFHSFSGTMIHYYKMIGNR